MQDLRKIYLYGICTKVFKMNSARIAMGAIPMKRKGRREITFSVKLISTSFMKSKLCSHDAEVLPRIHLRASLAIAAWMGECRG